MGYRIWKGLQFYLSVPRNQWRSQRLKDHTRAPRLPASSQQVSCRPASGSRPPLGSASAHKALGAPRAARASGSPAAGLSPAPRPPAGRTPSAPSHTRAALPVTQPGIGARGPRRPGRVGAGGTARRPDWGARPPAPARVCLPRALSVRLVRGFRGPLRWGLAPPRGKSAPALPAVRAAPGPAGVAFPPASAPPTTRWNFLGGEVFSPWLRALLPQLRQSEVSTAGDKRDRVSPSWRLGGECHPGLRGRARTLLAPRSLTLGRARALLSASPTSPLTAPRPPGFREIWAPQKQGVHC